MSSLFLIIFWSKLSLLSSTIITVNIRKVVYQKTFTLNRTEYVTPQSLPPHRGEGMTMKFLSYFWKSWLPGVEKHIGKEWDKLYKIHNCSIITGKRRMGDSELEKKWSDGCIKRCSGNVPFNKISSSEESNFILHKKLTKNPAIQCKNVPETHRIWDEIYSTDLWR